jgi:predicted dehydrogenase
MTGAIEEVAIVGFGRIAELAYVPALASGASRLGIASIADPDVARVREETAAWAEPPRIYASLPELLGQETPALVAIASPSHLHAQALLQLAGKGVPVLCEKPLVVDAAQLEAVRKAWAGCEDMLKVAHNYLYTASRARARSLLREGAIGEWTGTAIELAYAPDYFRGRTPWRTEAGSTGGPVLDVGYHFLYLAEFLAGLPMHAIASDPLAGHARAEGAASLACRHEGGAETAIHIAPAPEGVPGSSVIRINGSAGSIRLTGARKLEVAGPAGREAWEWPSSFSDGYREMMEDARLCAPWDCIHTGHFRNASRYLELLFGATF